MAIQVVIIDDEQILIDGLQALLGQDQQIQVIGAATQSSQAEPLIAKTKPDVVLMDLHFPEPQADGIETTAQLLSRYPQLNILMLTSYDDIMLIKEALRRGARGYVLKNTGKDKLVNAVKTVASGQRYLGEKVQNKVIDALLSDRQAPPKGDGSHPLTERELQIARLIAQGKKRKEIASELHLSINTVDTHLKNTFGKLEVNNVAALIQWMNKMKLL
ncbi:MAG: response regulator transcription factor [Bacteroidota bacterium]